MFLDTSGLYLTLDSRDSRHQTTTQLFDEAKRQSKLIITHDGVLSELVALAEARKVARAKTLHYISDLIANPFIRTIWTGELSCMSALDLLKRRLDKTYSLCYAISFLLMREHNITEALTTDHHFEQEGLIRLLDL